jgi:predicted nucleic-acid-binding Zn-ribbon protein
VTPEVKEINEEFNIKRFDVINCNKCRISEMYQAEIFV